jgi:uncharacterized membrane protein
MALRGLPALAIGIGSIAGLRSLTAPAMVSACVRRKELKLRTPRLGFLKSGNAGKAFTAVAIGELVADKLPFTPNRTRAPLLAARIAAGALCGAALYSSNKRPIAQGAVLGGLGAVAGSFAGIEVRRRLGRGLHLPDAALGAAEDALAITGGLAILRRAAA